MEEKPRTDRFAEPRFSNDVQQRLRPGLSRFGVPAPILAGALPCERRFYTLLLSRFQVECVPFDLLDDVLLQDLAFKAPQCTVQTFAFVELYLSQKESPFY
jgi:hypothetical protein